MNRAAALTTITGSDRLARHLHARAADAAIAEGRVAWERPDILPIGAFWRRLAGELAFHSEVLAQKRVLSRNAMLCRWEALVEASFSENPLLQTAGAARSALDAWLLVRDWQLDTKALADDPLEETRRLIEWGSAFEKECAEAGLLPDYAIPEAVLGALEQSADPRRLLPACVRLAGFMEISPRERAHLAALESLGVRVEWMPESPANADTSRIACTDARSETDAVAAWAREQVQRNPEARIGIIVPNLAGRRASLGRALTEALAPARLVHADDAPLPFNFSLGEPLAGFALVADALALLSLAGHSIEFAIAARLCRSPYLPHDAAARLALEGDMRREGYATFTPAEWRALAERKGCASFAESLQRFADDVRQDSGEALPSEWARRFSRWLDRLGWCHGRPLDSAEFQAREAWHDVLARLAELDPVLERASRHVALGWLNRMARETLFQPRAADAPVQVLGLLEATGVTFDALWVMGMDDETLPASPRPNPFLPIELQREKGLPSASAAREQQFAQRLFDGLCHAAPRAIFSFAAREGDAERRASPLLKNIPGMREDIHGVPSVSRAYFDARAEETFVDDRADPHRGGYVKGGTALLQNQSHCAFRAFAVHRLDAGEWPTPSNGPDARARGGIVHRAMEMLWTQWRTRAALKDIVEQGRLEGILYDTVTQVVERVARRESHRWTDGLRELEVERLVKVLKRWFENHELARPDFQVIEIEGQRADGSEVKTLVRAGPLELRGKLDRVDRLPDGGEIVIDYKTGEAPRKNDFFGERPAAPQLPAYAIARRQAGLPAPQGIAVASLKTGKEGLQGVMHVAGSDPKARPAIGGMENVVRTELVDSWEEALAHWERNIDALGSAFAAGEARVDPLRGVCDYCHLTLLCRIREQRELAEIAGEDMDHE